MRATSFEMLVCCPNGTTRSLLDDQRIVRNVTCVVAWVGVRRMDQDVFLRLLSGHLDRVPFSFVLCFLWLVRRL